MSDSRGGGVAGVRMMYFSIESYGGQAVWRFMNAVCMCVGWWPTI